MTEEELLEAEQLETAAITAAESGEFGHAATIYRQILEKFPGVPGEAQKDFGWNLGLMYRAAGDDEHAAMVLEHYGFNPVIDPDGNDGAIELPIDRQGADGFEVLKWIELHGKAAAVRSLELHRERVQSASDNVSAYLDDLLDQPNGDERHRNRLVSARTAFQRAGLELKETIDACVSALNDDKGLAIIDAFARVVSAYGHRDDGFVKAVADLDAIVQEVVDTGVTAELVVDGKAPFPTVGIETRLRKGVISRLRHPVETEPVAEIPLIGDQRRMFGKVIDLGKKLLEEHHKDIDAPKAGDHASRVDKLIQVLKRSHEHNRVEFEAMGDFTVEEYDPQTGDYRVILSTGARGRLVKQQNHKFVAEHSGSQMLDESQRHRIRLATAWLGRHWPDKLGEPPRDSASEISWNLDGAAFIRTLVATRPSEQPHLYGNIRLRAAPDYQQIARYPDLMWKQPCFGNFTLSLIVHPDGSCVAPTEDLGEAYLLETDGVHHESVQIENIDVLVAEQQAKRGWANVARGHLEYHYAYSELVASRNWALINDGRYTVDAIYREHWERYNDHLDTPFDTWMAFDHGARIAHLAHHQGRHRHHGHHDHQEHQHEHHKDRHGHRGDHEHRGHDRHHGHDRHQSHSRREHEEGRFHYGYHFAFADYTRQEELYDREYSGVDGTTLWDFIKALRTTIDERKGEIIERAHAVVLLQLHDDAWYASVYTNETENRPVVQYKAGTTSPSQLSEMDDAAEVITIEDSDGDTD